MALNLNNFKNVTLLYVEDDEFIRQQTSMIFKELFAHVLVCEDGFQAFEIYKREHNKIDIIATDIEMPKLNGIELATKIRQINADVPIIVTSAYNDEKYFKKAIDLEVGQYLKKPIKFKELSTAIELLLKKSAHKKHINNTNKFLTQKTKEFIAQHQQNITKLKMASSIYKSQEEIINRYVLRVECNLKAEVQYATDKFLSIFNIKIDDIKSKNITQVLKEPQNSSQLQKAILNCAKTKEISNFDIFCNKLNQRFNITITPIFSDDIISGYYIYFDMLLKDS